MLVELCLLEHINAGKLSQQVKQDILASWIAVSYVRIISV